MWPSHDPAGKLAAAKDKPAKRIDGIVALIMAIGRDAARRAPFTSVYEHRGLLILGLADPEP